MIKGKKKLLASFLYHSRLLYIPSIVAGNKLIVFNYHRIRSEDEPFTNFDDGVFCHTASQFFAQIKWLKQNTDVLSESDLLDHLNNGGKKSGVRSMITFDDGYIDNFTIAYPILKSLDVPAIYFIPTHHINTRELGWWDVIAYLIKTTKIKVLNFEGTSFFLPVQREAAISYFLKKMKLEKHEFTKNLIAKISMACEIPLPDLEIQDKQLMTWEHVMEISRHNISIGSHTHTHRVLATIDRVEQREELSVSKAIIEAKVGKKVRSVSWPVGNYQHFTKDTQVIAAECGYELGFSFFTGINKGMEFERFNIKRLGAPDKLEMFATMTYLPYIWGY